MSSPAVTRRWRHRRCLSRGRVHLGLLIGALLLLCGVATATYWLQQCRPRTIKVALVGPMSGPYADVGRAMERGAHLYLDRLRDDTDRRVEIKLVRFDDLNEPDLAKETARNIVHRGDIDLVIGHYSSQTAASAGPVYQEAGIPAITGSATGDSVTQGNDWYFSLMPTDHAQGRLIASYMKSVLGVGRVTIVHDSDDYGVALAQGFEEAAGPLGIEIRDKLTFGTWGDILDRELERVAQKISKAEEPGMIFLATRGREGLKLITSLYGQGLSFFGPHAFGDEEFRKELLTYPQEQVQPGYYVNGLYSTIPLLLGTAQRKTHDFHYAFQRTYHENPSWVAAAYFDAATLATQALEHAVRAAHGKPGRDLRDEARHYLASINRPEKMVFGVTGEILFDSNGSVVRPLAVGNYHGHHQVAAPVQLQLVRDERRIDNILKEVLEGRILFINQQFMYRTQVVYTGVDLNEIRNFNIDDSSFLADFYIWFRSEGAIDPSQIEFLNSVAPVELKEPLVDTVTDGLTLKTYKVRAEFRGEFDFFRFPFDEQALPILLRHDSITRDRLIFVPDVLGMRDSEESVKDPTTPMGPAISGWQVRKMQFFQDEIRSTSSFGIPAFFDSGYSLDFSRFNAITRIARDAGSYILKNLFPMVFVVLLAYLVFYINEFKVRMSTAASALLTTAFFHLKLSAGIPVSYLVAIEYYFYAIYALIGVSLSTTIIFHRLEVVERSDPERREWARMANRRMDLIGRWLFPILVISVSAWIWHTFSTF